MVIPGGVNSDRRTLDPPIVFRRASGAYVEDTNNRRYLDVQLGFGAIILGHGDSRVASAVGQAILDLDLICAGATALEVEVAETIAEIVPGAERVLFCNSGSEAVSHAVRLARGFTRRRKILRFAGCYHGWNDVVIPTPAYGPGAPSRGDRSTGVLFETTAETLVVEYNDLDAVREALADWGHDLAAIIVEPIAHNLGSVLPDSGFLEGLREEAHRVGALLIYDEVITGFRHSLGGYQAISGVIPDLSTMAKAMANGIPCALVCGRADVLETTTTVGGPVLYAGTFNANGAAMAAARATISALREPGVYEHLFGMGEALRDGLTKVIASRGYPCRVAGYGSVHILYFQSEIPRSNRDLNSHNDVLDVRYRNEMIRRGVLILPHARMRSYLSLAHTREDVNLFLDAASSALEVVFDGSLQVGDVA